jgi:predicted O-methyltransferase YrrM
MLLPVEIISHDTFKTSLTRLREINSVIEGETFHEHTHVLLTLLNITKAKSYVEIGTFSGSSMCLALQAPIQRAIGIDTMVRYSADHIMNNIRRVCDDECEERVILHKNRSDDYAVLAEVTKELQSTGGADVIFIDGGHNTAQVLSDFNNFSKLVCPGGILAFDDYMDRKYSPQVRGAVDKIVANITDEWNVIGCIDNVLGAKPTEFSVSNVFLLQRKEITFAVPTVGIVMTTYKRELQKTDRYNPSVESLEESLAGVASQTFDDYHLIVVGDDYTDDAELRNVLATSNIEQNKISIFNLPAAYERFTLRTVHEKWCSGGVTATNYGLGIARRLGCAFHARLDDDDVWSPDHLANHVSVMEKDTECSIVFSHALFRGVTPATDRVLPSQKGTFESTPIPSGCAHSSVVWRLLNSPLQYFSYRIVRGVPADHDAWNRISKMDIKGICIAEITCTKNANIQRGR